MFHVMLRRARPRQVMKNLYSLAVAKLEASGEEGEDVPVSPVGEEDVEWLKENLRLDQMNAAISALGTEEVGCPLSEAKSLR